MAPDFHLANGQLLNLQPPRDKSALSNSDAINSREGAVEIGTRSESNNSDAETDSPSSQHKPTRLPVLKLSVDKEQLQRNNNVDSPKQRERQPSGLQSRIPRGSRESESPKSTDQERERYWRKVRDKLDRDSPISRDKDKQKSPHREAYRKIISLASSPRQEIAKHKWKYSGSSSAEKLGTPEISPAAKDSKFSLGHRNESDKSHVVEQDQFTNGTVRTKSNHSASSNGSGTSSSLRSKTDGATDSSYNSNSSVSPISGPTTSMKEWEDRFVVHMPSAREPNPPTMNVHQITAYQRSIDRVQKEGEAMLDPDTLPSPRAMTPEGGQAGKRLGTLDGQDSRPAQTNTEDESRLTYIPSHRRYYCPDEVGKQRFSTIWEESSTGPKQVPSRANPDGSFLGCREINGPDVRNPDEILYFSTPERPKVVTIPSRLTRFRRESNLALTRRMKGASGETSLIQEEWEPISQNLKHAQCSKPSPKLLCREAQCQQLKTKKSTSSQEREGRDSIEISARSSENRKLGLRADDVFIITPTITRTMVTMTDLRGHVHSSSENPQPSSRAAGELITDIRTKLPINTKAGASPSGLRRVSQNSWEKSNAPSAIPSKLVPTTSTPARPLVEAKVTTAENSNVDKRRVIRGSIRTPGIPRSSTESRINPVSEKPSDSAASSPASRASNILSRRTPPTSPEARHSSPPNRIIRSPPAPQKSPQSRDTMMRAKIVDVAELDGQQVEDQHETDSGPKISCLNHDQPENDLQPQPKEVIGSETFHMIVDMVFLFLAQVQGFCQQIKANRGSKLVLLKLFLHGILGMLEHCLHFLRKGLAILSAYNTTGAWPEADDKDLTWSFTEFGQALVYLVVLVFIAMLIARVVGFVILIGVWMVWLARPFALAFRAVSRVLSV
ncbi:hypothetical protein BJX68DRAFT_177728 [Aspergillus pseudodeflectus]|uniref:NTP binding protein n=1 Tax=Aspergillus pseudodeflectus TaxID=176178 RepID=A0ABR4KZ12_9EURO